ncbi:MAG: peptidase family protein, partial [Nocardioides sp.]|nr:peptidase family protein [Nocardioides sp.]
MRPLLPFLAAALVLPLVGVGPPALAAPARQITHTQWDTTAGLGAGTLAGTRLGAGRVVLAGSASRHREYRGTTYDEGRWVSPWTSPGFGLTELVASWSARTPGDSWVEVSVRGRSADGATSSWDVLARWASGDRFVRRTTVSGQHDDLASVNVDTWVASRAAGLASWQLRVSLLRRAGAA